MDAISELLLEQWCLGYTHKSDDSTFHSLTIFVGQFTLQTLLSVTEELISKHKIEYTCYSWDGGGSGSDIGGGSGKQNPRFLLKFLF